MKIKQINKIKSCRTFRDFSWPTGLQQFQDCNLIYGWNGTGKTTIADIFRAIERKQTSFEGEFEIQTDTGVIKNTDLESGWTDQIPPIRVFNRTYVEENIFHTSNGEITPIFFLGEENVEKQKRVEALTKSRSEENTNYQTLIAQKKKKDGDLDALCIRGAKAVKDALLSSVDSSYNNYNKSHFSRKIDAMIATGNDASSYQQTDEQLAELRKRFEGTAKDSLPVPTITLPDLDSLHESATALAQRTVVTSTIEALKNDDVLSAWVETGLGIHKHGKYDNCQFCLQPLPAARVQSLEGHFNDAYSKLNAEIDLEIEKLNTHISNLAAFSIPDKAALADHLTAQYIAAQTAIQAVIAQYSAYIRELRDNLQSKKSKIFEVLTINPNTPENGDAKLEEYLNILRQHNEDCENHSTTIKNARRKYEESIVSAYISEYQQLKTEASDAETSANSSNQNIGKLTEEIQTLEQQIKEHHKAADQINADLVAYLGHDELKFAPKENGYVIHRFGLPAPIKELSEGEKTAIALLYFLKTLQDKSFNQSGIVVIDDPVCSRDDGALFHAFGYIKERTKTAKQLFILTHNFMFFRQVRDWFNAIQQYEKPKKKSFYQTHCWKETSGRRSDICKIDDLLVDYESEYHYLFKLIYSASDQTVTKLADYYHMPNVARRVMESFLAFRKPSYSGRSRLRNSLKDIDFDTAKKERILRFVHAHSHEDHIGTPDHDASILSETPQIMIDLLALINKADPGHHAEMLKVIGHGKSAEIINLATG